jgi:hypothetical protein
LVSWPVEKVVAEIPDTMKAAEIMSAMITLRMSLSPIVGSDGYMVAYALPGIRGIAPRIAIDEQCVI